MKSEADKHLEKSIVYFNLNIFITDFELNTFSKTPSRIHAFNVVLTIIYLSDRR